MNTTNGVVDWKRLPLACLLGFVAYGLGIVVWYFWHSLQVCVGDCPTWMKSVASQTAYWGVYATLGFMVLGVLPPYHRVRICGDLLGLFAFLFSLLYEKTRATSPLKSG